MCRQGCRAFPEQMRGLRLLQKRLAFAELLGHQAAHLLQRHLSRHVPNGNSCRLLASAGQGQV